MAYNLQPLITILEGILDPLQTRWIVDESNPQLQSLLDKATSLQQLIDKSPLTKINILDSQIREVAHQAEDILESHMVDQMLSGSNCARFTLSTPDLQQVTRDLDSVMEQVEKPTETTRELDSAVLKVDDKKLRSSSSSNVVVGIDADLKQLKERLTWTEKKLEIIPIVGMGGVASYQTEGGLIALPKVRKNACFTPNCLYRWTTSHTTLLLRGALITNSMGFLRGYNLFVEEASKNKNKESQPQSFSKEAEKGKASTWAICLRRVATLFPIL
ncbi:putative disease resistance protein [Salvia divinorum]|uniref:Disease resistance protein n=1 Tax=Salvia divinorum TaxID=28513 RepID=A0ABD1I0E4_SALDI